MIQNHAHRSARASGENLFGVLLMMAPPSQDWEPPANPARSKAISPYLKHAAPLTTRFTNKNMSSERSFHNMK